MFAMTMIVYVDYVLLAVLLFLTFFTCGYCVYRVYNLQQHGQIEVLLKPTKVLFSHKKEGIGTDELRTVVAYQNPLTGEYCVRKSRPGVCRGYSNAAASPSPSPSRSPPASPPSPQYEPLPPAPPDVSHDLPRHHNTHMEHSTNSQVEPANGDNSLNKTWNWNYKEYQI